MSIQQTEVPRETLKQLLEKNGEGLFQDRDRCEGLLKDHCGSTAAKSPRWLARWTSGFRWNSSLRGNRQ